MAGRQREVFFPASAYVPDKELLFCRTMFYIEWPDQMCDNQKDPDALLR